MEQMRKGKKNIKLRNAFVLYVFTTFLLVVSLSAVVIAGCAAIRNWLLPQSDEVFLNIEQREEDGSLTTATLRMKIGDDFIAVPYLLDSETTLESLIDAKYSVTSIENSFTSLSPKRQLLYRGCTVAMVAAPVLLSLGGILFCGFFFYNRKLKKPIEVLADATDKISAQDLDFEISYQAGDELGALCRSFEQMREALVENNQKLWEMIEERKQLQASVAHDLRNPIAIIEGHAEYLRLNLPLGKVDEEKILSISGNIEKAAKRLENYTESIRTINHLENLEIKRKTIVFDALYSEITEDLKVLANPYSMLLICENNAAVHSVSLDVQVLYRILENLVSNAARFAKSKIVLSFDFFQDTLAVTVSDDGCGFSDDMLKARYGYMPAGVTDEEHFGMGLMICRILAKKHGGSLTLGNGETGGAMVKITLAV
ncbi:MAG: HAMP domain-containing sensor histidine kinase [Oscillospiraceae bacterium]|nr:HAMP domain-containing sensor histidine kinase [Oscillospiraceae bacterium]